LAGSLAGSVALLAAAIARTKTGMALFLIEQLTIT
jgi:hypothetical protein